MNPDQATDNSQISILLIDDEPQILKTVKRYIEADGYRILTAKDGNTGLDIFREKRPQLIITDVKMPGLSGLDVLKQIKAIDKNAEVIVVTGHGDMEISVEALRLDASDFIAKPVDMELLQLSIARAVEKRKMRNQIKKYTENLEKLLKDKTKEIKNSQAMLMQSEKLASIGQLAAGVAHEINNPVGFISSNLDTMHEYIKDFKKILKKYQTIHFIEGKNKQTFLEEVKAMEEDIDVEYILEDIEQIFQESNEGIERVKNIVVDLKDFAHIDKGEKLFYDINKGIESTLNIVWNELKYKAELVKDLGKIPEIECYPQQINQVIMNFLTNAAQAIDEWGKIEIKTGLISDKGKNFITVTVKDTGCGIPEENLSKIFDPFFTTKDVGKGTGLGLNISFKVIEKHNGEIKVKSKVGQGTTFIIKLPVEADQAVE